MRLVLIPNCEYSKFESIRDIIVDNIPFCLLDSGYSKNLKKAWFNFWDVEYIPMNLRDYILQPPASRENVERLLSELGDI